MAAYAALVSLMHVIDQIQLHPRPPISLNKKQVESLTEKVTFLQDFLENHSHGVDSEEADGLESRIADAVYEAEDIIESHIVDQILVGSTSNGQKYNSIYVYEGLEKVIDDMDLIKKEVMEIKKKNLNQNHPHRNPTPADSVRLSFTGQNLMVGFDHLRDEIIDKLIGQQSNRQIIPIVGMGGIGKTTLARNVYLTPHIQQYFDVCAWTSISQKYSTREILKEVLFQVNKEGREDVSKMSEDELGEKLYKYLSGRRYLVVMDDMWSIEVWDKIKFFFPDCYNGSRIAVTTRLSNLAFQLNNSYQLQMKFLEVDKSWNLLCRIVFGKEGCPLELEEIGKKIAQGCKGLPLSIVVIGGLLAKSRLKREYWDYIAENLNSVVNLEDNEHCLNILYMSYNQLPVYLKPCFLYMGVFPEDEVIRVSMLIKQWVTEGFLKPISGKSLEEAAEKYFKDLIDRNLILVHKLGSIGNIKYCSMHDLLRDLCLREAQKVRFYNVIKQHSFNIPQGKNTHRNIVFPEWLSPEEKFPDPQSMPLARSFICYSRSTSPPPLNFRLLRILKAFDKDFGWRHRYSLEKVYNLVNLRYIAVTTERGSRFCSSIYRLWNLHTLIVNWGGFCTAPSEIWKMPQLRHVKFNSLVLPDPPNGNDIILENLLTLSTITSFKCSEEIIKRIPNIKKLGVFYHHTSEKNSNYFLNKLERLGKLESFLCNFDSIGPRLRQNLTFPHSLKKLTISRFHSEDILEKIGSLPLLEKLQLRNGFFNEGKWETVEGQFYSLKFLKMEYCSNLKYWRSDKTHFPRLERLDFSRLGELEEIPSDIGEIPTLQSIQLRFCSDSAIISAKNILREQEELGNEGLQVQVTIELRGRKGNPKMKNLASPNFRVEYC